MGQKLLKLQRTSEQLLLQTLLMKERFEHDFLGKVQKLGAWVPHVLNKNKKEVLPHLAYSPDLTLSD